MLGVERAYAGLGRASGSGSFRRGCVMSVKDLCDEILRRRTESLERRIEKYPRNNPIASDIGECGREMVLSILHWEERGLPSPKLKPRFGRGTLVEDPALREVPPLEAC